MRQSDQMVVLAPNVGWQNLPLPRMLLVECGLDLPVVVENEAALAALAETRRGAALNLDSVLCVWGEVGIGGGTVSGGQLMQGASGFAGEIGHLPINLDGERCGCGAIGCLETELGEESLLRRAGRPPNGGRAALTELFADAAAGKPSVIDALAEQGRWLGIGLAGVINLLDPDVVVLGGFLGEALPFMVDTMKAELDTRSIAAIRRDLSVVAGACGSHAPLLGAAEMAWERVISNPLESLERRMFVSELA
ncbi:MAG: ROK family protein [Acidimicrobiaceae bacterium]|nr:ROK family protein [Acidimicrobiaceae bacterium]MCO4832516.1 ROK family protein [Acidimicrobiaceae bacterium]